MISAEKETEFCNSDYDNIKKAVSIWICLSDEIEDGSIEKIEMQPSILYGKETGMLSVDLMEGYLIGLRNKDNVKESKNRSFFVVSKEYDVVTNQHHRLSRWFAHAL